MTHFVRFTALSVVVYFGGVVGLDLGSYEVDSVHARRADSILNAGAPDVVFPNPHPGAQWYKTAGVGTMLHWGIYSVDTLEPSWAMMRNFQWVSNPLTREAYYALAEKFNPSDYDPEKWAAAWKKAGMRYAVLTTKHHDGYALWPTKYGNMSTRVYMDGRDLVKPYVEACRKYGIKVGLYFSQPDWHYPGYRGTNVALVDGEWVYDAKPPRISAEENQERFEQFYAYVIAQLEELLTRYGTIDLLWFDGDIWLDAGGGDVPEKTIAWIRSIHPGIVVNERFGGTGDFISYEIKEPVNPPPSWWEYIGQFGWGAGWGPSSIFASPREFVARTTEMTEMGGNFTPNMSPMPDGTYHPRFYELCNGVEKIISPDATPPVQAPANVKALPVSYRQVNVSWDAVPPGADPETGISEYRVYRNGAFAGGTRDTFFVDTSLKENTMYTYQVAAVNGQGKVGPKSSTVSATTPPSNLPAAPTGRKHSNALRWRFVFHRSNRLLRYYHPLTSGFGVDIFSSSGAWVGTLQGNSAGTYDIPLRGKPKGLYAIELRTGEQNSTRKLVLR